MNRIEQTSNYACVLTNQLYFGNAKPARNENVLKELNIKSIVDLINYEDESKRIMHSSYFNVFHLSVQDIPTNTISWCEEASKFIENELNKNNLVYVHCSQGISRSTTLILHYLLTRKQMRLKEAFITLKQLRHVIAPSAGFIEGLIELEKQLYGEISITKKEYAVICLKEVFPKVEVGNIDKEYDLCLEKVNNNKEFWEIKRVEKNIEPIGYSCFDELEIKYGNAVQRFGCSKHHPFD